MQTIAQPPAGHQATGGLVDKDYVVAQNKQSGNVEVIIVDDQSPFDLKVYDPESALETPVLDRLAAEGMTIDGAYHMGSWSGAVCTPSRHMVMSGRSVWHLPRNVAENQSAEDQSTNQCSPHDSLS